MPDFFNQTKLRILIFRGGALGDFMLTLPAISALRRLYPRAYIELAGYPQSACLALTTGLVNCIQSLDLARMALFFQKEIKLPPDEIRHIRSFDLIITYLHDPEGILLGHLKETGAKNIIAVSPMVGKCHAADHFFSGLKSILGNEINKCPSTRLEWPPALKGAARNRLLSEVGEQQVIIIHPGSGRPAKNWPADKFAALAKKIRAGTDYLQLIIGGAADEKAIAVMRPLLPGFRFLVNAPLTDVASILSVADGFIGNDSGITHLAAALGIPVVALFGPTDPAIWGPRGKNVCVLKSKLAKTESLSEITVEEVFKKIIELKPLDSE